MSVVPAPVSFTSNPGHPNNCTACQPDYRNYVRFTRNCGQEPMSRAAYAARALEGTAPGPHILPHMNNFAATAPLRNGWAVVRDTRVYVTYSRVESVRENGILVQAARVYVTVDSALNWEEHCVDTYPWQGASDRPYRNSRSSGATVPERRKSLEARLAEPATTHCVDY